MSKLEEQTASAVEKINQTAGDHDPAGRIGCLLGDRYRITAQRSAHDHVEEYAARDERGGESVLVRLVPHAPPPVRERFGRCMSQLGKAHHPCLPAILNHGLLDRDTPYYVTPYIDGDRAVDLLQLDAIDVEEAVQIASGVASGLMAAHKAGVVHGDIRPSNIVVVRRADGGADTKILDFGLAPELSVVRPVAKRTVPGIGDARPGRPAQAAFGSLPYASPEQIRGEPATERSDVYVLAAVLYELLSGTPPFPRDAERIVSGKLDPPSRRAPEKKLPEAFDRALLAALSAEPEGRPGSPAELGSLLWQALAEAKRGVRLPSQVEPEADEPSGPVAGLPPPRKSRKPALALIAALLLLFAAGWLFGRKTTEEASPAQAPSAPALASAPPPPSAAAPASAEPSIAPDAALSAPAKMVLAAPAKPRSPRPEPSAQGRAGSSATPSNYRVDDLKTPYR